MSTKLFFGKSSLVAIVAVALCANLAYGRGGGGGHSGGGHGGGHAGGGFHAGGGHSGGFHTGGGHAGGGYGGAAAFHAAGGGLHPGTFRSGAPSHTWSGGQFAHNGSFAGRYGNNFAGRYGNNFAGRYGNTFAGRYGNWAGNHGWDNYFRGGYRGGGWGGYGGWGGGYWPWYSGWGWGGNWAYPYGYGYYPYSYPYTSDYSYSYAPSAYNDYYFYAPSDNGGYYSYPPSTDGDAGVVVDPGVTAPQIADSSAPAPAEGDGLTTGPPEDQPAAGEAMKSYSAARAAFLHGNYQNALRLASHAAVDAPRNAKVHELLSLALFAAGKYGPAAGEAHAAMAMGTIADWKDLFGYYNDADKYTAQLAALEVEKYKTQLRALEKALAENPNSAAGHFLLGYHYLMIGARDNAKTQFADAVRLTPDDKLAGHYLQELQSNSQRTPPEMASRPQGTAL